nr:MgtC/SapB family protein [uncultured Pseudomonas sp.]
MSPWQTIETTLISEFSDLTEVDHATRVCIRLLLAALLGGMLGYERETHGHAAGLRTHMLVAIGSALFVLVPELANAGHDAISRVFQGIITGIGFLGAGTILKGDRVSQVRGLTTAAGIWLTAAIGITVGFGQEATAVLGTLLALFVLNVVPHVIDRLQARKNSPR